MKSNSTAFLIKIKLRHSLGRPSRSDFVQSNFGLGLSIAKELTQMLNGIIIINDTAGGGATFTVKFPLK